MTMLFANIIVSEYNVYSWHLSLMGVISNLVVMFYVDYEFGTGALICEIAVFIFLLWRAPQNVWGDVTKQIRNKWLELY